MPGSSRIYVLDTNALLNDPDVVYSFSGAEVVIPAVVIAELDKIKRRRTDRRVRFHGRKATRLLFDLSRTGRLVDGVQLANGSRLRIDEMLDMSDAPAGLDLKRPDDQILALTSSLDQGPGVHATLVSNDLNLLLRAELLGLSTYRFEGKLEHMMGNRPTPTEWFRENWHMLLLAALTVILSFTSAYLYFSRPGPNLLADLNVADDAVVLRDLGVSPQVLEEHYRDRLAKDPTDAPAMVNMGNLLFDQGRYLEAVDFYRSALNLDPARPRVRTDLGIALLHIGQYQEAIRAFEQTAREEPDSALFHYNLGVALAQAGDQTRALEELETAVRLSGDTGVVPMDVAESLIADLRSKLSGS
jgi:tetratricopeptide (TPR) repeat protein